MRHPRLTEIIGVTLGALIASALLASSARYDLGVMDEPVRFVGCVIGVITVIILAIGLRTGPEK